MNTSISHYSSIETHANQGTFVDNCYELPNISEQYRSQQVGTLKTALSINAIMFFVMTFAALHANSTSLLADCVDYLGDALTYGLSLAVVASGIAAKAKVAMFKGFLILAAAIIVAGQIVYKLMVPSVPVFEVMGIFSLVSLAANSVCFFLLSRYKDDDINMSSVWQCSLNDIAVNVSIFIAAGAVWLLESGWPDIVVASVLVVFLARSAVSMLISAYGEMRNASS